jgi:hypothetical protein
MNEYMTDSLCWSAIGFLLGYFVCRLEVEIRERFRRDDT